MTSFTPLFLGLLLLSSHRAVAAPSTHTPFLHPLVRASSVGVCSIPEIAVLLVAPVLSDQDCNACYEGQGETFQLDPSNCPPGCCITARVSTSDPGDVASGNYAAHLLYCSGRCCVRAFIDKRTKGGVAQTSATFVNNVDYRANDDGECVPAGADDPDNTCGPKCALSARKECLEEDSLQVPDFGDFPSNQACAIPLDTESLVDSLGTFPIVPDDVSLDTFITAALSAGNGATAVGNGDDDDDDDDDDATCFPADAVVFLDDGQGVRMDQLQHGQRVRVSADTYSEVIGFTHADRHVMHRFLTLSTSGGTSITLTPTHYLYVNGVLVPARRATIGDMLRLEDGTEGRIVEVKREQKRGLFNPQTMNGDVVVGGVVASTYTTTVPPEMGHALLSPVRALPGMCGAVLAGIADMLRPVVSIAV